MRTLKDRKKDLKKSLARMMLCWVIHTRHSLREELLAGNPDGEWAELALKEAFDNDKEWREFFHEAAEYFKANPEIVIGAEKINARVDGLDGRAAWWVPDFKNCPAKAFINVEIRAAYALADEADEYAKVELSPPGISKKDQL